jgi:Zn-dependent M28 family amino/carboxypeptidase
MAVFAQSPTESSPGANDDGTGTAALMQIARAISEAGLTFRYSLMLAGAVLYHLSSPVDSLLP